MLIPPPHDEGTDEAAQVDRLMRQYDENTHRESLTAADEAGFVAELLDLGMSAATIQRRARLPKATVQAAQAVRESDTARAAVSKHTALTIQQAAGIAEFDGNPEAVKHLIDAAERGSFDHQLQRLGDSRKEQEAIAAKREELAAEGIRTSDARLSWEYQITEYVGPDGKRLTPETHTDCPGHVGLVHAMYGGKLDVVYYCEDPKANGH